MSMLVWIPNSELFFKYIRYRVSTYQNFIIMNFHYLNKDRNLSDKVLYSHLNHRKWRCDACIRRSCPETSLLFKTILIIISPAFVTYTSKRSLYKGFWPKQTYFNCKFDRCTCRNSVRWKLSCLKSWSVTARILNRTGRVSSCTTWATWLWTVPALHSSQTSHRLK